MIQMGICHAVGRSWLEIDLKLVCKSLCSRFTLLLPIKSIVNYTFLHFTFSMVSSVRCMDYGPSK